MQRKTYRDICVVLRTHKLSEADRIITLLTRANGKVRAVAKGVRRTSSRFGARLEPSMVVDLQLYQGRNLDTITQAETVAPYGRWLTADYQKYTAAQVMLETADKVITAERQPATQQFLLLVKALGALSSKNYDPDLVLDAYLLRTMAIAGWAASFDGCAKCGEPGPHQAFASAAGGMVCRVCRPAGANAPRPGTVALLAALQSSNWAVANDSDVLSRRQGSTLVAGYVQWHLERIVKSLKIVERVEAGEY